MKSILKVSLLLLPLFLLLNCWDETTSTDDKKVEPVTITVTAVKDSLGSIFTTSNDCTATPENAKLLFVKTQDLDYIDSIGALFYTGQSLEIGGKISIACDNLSDSIFKIGSLIFPNTGTYKVFYFAKIIDSTNLIFVDTINFVVGGIAPKITANDTTDTVFTIQELKTLQIQFKALGQYTSSAPYFSSILELPSGAIFDSATGMFSYKPDTSVSKKDSSFVLPTITVTASDNSTPPISNSLSFTIQVTDSTEIIYPDPVIIITAGDSSIAYLDETFIVPSVTAYDSILGNISDSIKLSGVVDSSSLGVYKLIFSVIGASEVTVSETLTVTVVDTIKPVIVIAGNNPLTHYVHTSFIEPTVSATDNNDGDLSAGILKLGSVDTSILGSYKISYDVSDSSGNSQTDTLTINVIDTTAPVITLEGNNPDTVLLGGGAYSDPGATAQDNADGLITFEKFTVTGTVNKDSLGSYTRTYNVSDISGNTATSVTRAVIVIDAPDTTAPIVMINGGDKTDTVWVGAPYTLPIAMASDNKDGMIGNDAITKTPSTAVTTTAGTFKFVYTATDAASNVGADTLTLVVVADTVKPVITILGKNPDTIDVGDTYTLLSAVAIDNKDDTISVTTSGSVNNSVAGTNIITYTATDGAGNIGTELLVVVVEDIAPAITIQPRDTSIDIEKTVTFKVTATGTNLSYQWKKNGVDITQAVFSEYTTPVISKADTNSVFTCVVSNSAGSVVSDGGDLTPVWFVGAAGGYKHSHFLKSDGTLWASGANHMGQLGTDGGSYLIPIKVLSDVIKVCASNNYTIVIKKDLSLWSNWAVQNSIFQQSQSENKFYKIAENVLDASIGGHILYKNNNGEMWAVGSNSYGALGDSTTVTKLSPVRVKIGNNVKSFSTGWNSSFFMSSDSLLWVTGWNMYGQLGTSDTTNVICPKRSFNSKIIEISSGSKHSFVITNNSDLYGTGSNENGQLGLENTPSFLELNLVDSSIKSAYTNSYSSHSFYLKNDGTLKAMGKNNFGQLGNNSMTDVNIPVSINFEGDIQSITLGCSHSFFILKDGTLWGCGYNSHGQLGDGTSENKIVPVKITF